MEQEPALAPEPEGKPGVLYGIAGVGIRIFGHKDGVLVSQWMQRNPGWPAPAFTVEPGRGGEPDKLWHPSQAPEWHAYRASFPGRGKPGVPKPGSGNRGGSSVTVRSGPAVVGHVLDGYALCAPVPKGTQLRAAREAAGGRLVTAGAGAGRVIWARDQADADAASTAVPALKFGPRP